MQKDTSRVFNSPHFCRGDRSSTPVHRDIKSVCNFVQFVRGVMFATAVHPLMSRCSKVGHPANAVMGEDELFRRKSRVFIKSLKLYPSRTKVGVLESRSPVLPRLG